MKTILIVDDEFDLRSIIQEDLQAEGHIVLTANSGKEALEILDKVKIDFILSDIKMPNGDGIFLLKEVRKRHASLPVMALMTGYSEVTNSEAQELGALAIYQKPFDIDKFAKMIGLSLKDQD